jgi:hypothetical protein
MSLSGVFALAAFVSGFFCVRLRTALVVGAVPALLYASLVVVGLWHLLPGANLVYLGGALGAACLAILMPAVVASYLRRGIERQFRRGKTAETA